MMNRKEISRRRFIERTAALAGAVVLTPLGLPAFEKQSKRTAVDQVSLGKTGIRLSRLGIGTGTNGGRVQRDLGRDGFARLVRYAYDQGITYIDTAQAYRTHEMVREAIKGLPREKLFIQSKMGGVPDKPLEMLDRFRKELNVDYIDSLLVHCAYRDDWVERRKPLLDAFEEAKEKKIIRSHGVSCHSIPAMAKAAQLDWVDVHLVRINPQGIHIDTPIQRWDAKSNKSNLPAALDPIKIMRQKRRGMIGMKILGEGEFTNMEEREKSIRFAMQCDLLDAVVIGFKSTAEIDEAIRLMNGALAEKA